MKRLLIALAFLFIPGIAWAQCTGVFPANTLCGNLKPSPQPPAAFAAGGTVVGPASSTSGAVVTWANNIGSLLGPGTTSVFSQGTSGAIQQSNGTSGFIASTLTMLGCNGCSSTYLQLPSNPAVGSVVFGNFTGPATAGLSLTAHELIGCWGCQVNTAAAGSTAFVGWDGSNSPILGNPSGSGGFHMAALGSSVVCESDETVCIGHAATSANLGAAFDVIIGSSASHAGSGSPGADVLIGNAPSDTGSGGNNVLITAASGGSLTGSSTANILVNGGVTCTMSSISRTVGIGRSACPTVSDHAVIGGPLLTDFYAGTETQPQAAGHFSTIIQTGPQTKTANYNPNVGDNTITFNCGGTCQVGLGNVATTGYKLRIHTIGASVSSFASNIVPIGGGAAQALILPATAGKWADIEYDGTNWEITAGN